MSCAILGARDRAGNRTAVVTVLMKLALLGEEDSENKQRVCQVPISIMKKLKQRRKYEGSRVQFYIRWLEKASLKDDIEAMIA